MFNHVARLRPRAAARGTAPAPFGILALATLLGSGCTHVPVKPWQREHLAKRAMTFDDGLEGRFRQHLFSSREGSDGGYGTVGGGCGCN